MSEDKRKLSEEIIVLANARKRTIATAESCTGGLISSLLTDIPGASNCFWGGMISCRNGVKEKIMGVSRKLIKGYGVYSKEVALEMAYRIRLKFKSDLGPGISGVASPPPENIPKAGAVFIAVCKKDSNKCQQFAFSGNRIELKESCAFEALKLLRQEL